MKVILSPSAAFAVFVVILLAFFPFMYFWEGRDPDSMSSYVYCNMTYRVDEISFTAMIALLWIGFMNYIWYNFEGVVRERLIVVATIHVFLNYLLGRTTGRAELHNYIILALMFSTIAIFVLSRRWNWLFIIAFILPGLFSAVLLWIIGGNHTDKENGRSIMWMYAISTHWPTFVFVLWLLVAPSLPIRIGRFDYIDRAFDLNSNKQDCML